MREIILPGDLVYSNINPIAGRPHPCPLFSSAGHRNNQLEGQRTYVSDVTPVLVISVGSKRLARFPSDLSDPSKMLVLAGDVLGWTWTSMFSKDKHASR